MEQIGNIYNIRDIEAAISEEYSLDEGIITSPYFPRWGAIDPAFGSSDFGTLVVQWRDNKLECVFCDSITKPLYIDMLKLTRQLVQRFHLCHLYVDSSAAGIIHELKQGYNEYVPFERLPADVLYRQIQSACGEPLIIPIPFPIKGKSMLQHSYKVLSKNMVRILPSFDKLMVGLRTAQSNGEWDYDKLHNSQYTDRLLSFGLFVSQRSTRVSCKKCPIHFLLITQSRRARTVLLSSLCPNRLFDIFLHLYRQSIPSLSFTAVCKSLHPMPAWRILPCLTF